MVRLLTLLLVLSTTPIRFCSAYSKAQSFHSTRLPSFDFLQYAVLFQHLVFQLLDFFHLLLISLYLLFIISNLGFNLGNLLFFMVPTFVNSNNTYRILQSEKQSYCKTEKPYGAFSFANYRSGLFSFSYCFCSSVINSKESTSSIR